MLLPADRWQRRLPAGGEVPLPDARFMLGSPQGITASTGVAEFPGHASDPAELVRGHRSTLQAAKALGRDRAVIYSPEVTGAVGAVAGSERGEPGATATVLSLAEALSRDSYTAKHSQTVGRLCEMMALGLDEGRVQRVRLAGILAAGSACAGFDSGQAGKVHDEMDQMRRHPEMGARILASDDWTTFRRWSLTHHERPDGSGYPKGRRFHSRPRMVGRLRGDDQRSRLSALHRAQGGQEQARKAAGTRFERVVDALLRALKRAGPDHGLALAWRASGRGDHHAISPQSCIKAGIRKALTRVASISTTQAVRRRPP